MIPAVEMRGITKYFPGVIANNNIDFTVEKGEIHGLLGENGAGKTVLMSILYGLYHANEGEIYLNGTRVNIDSPAIAMNLGIGMVHQHFMLIPSLTVSENVVLGQEPSRNGLINEDQMLKRVRASCTKYKLDIVIESPVHTLSVGIQQRVEILKALYRGADLLILDEPTAVLTPQEVEDLFRVIHSLKEQGKTVIFISHKLREVLYICDRVTVLKQGNVVGTVEASQTDMEKLAEMMVGRRVFYNFKRASTKVGETVLKIEGLEALDDRSVPTLRGLNLEIRESEILGLAGVEGNGQSELIESIMGLRKIKAGKIFLSSKDITRELTDVRIRSGISHIPEDRHKLGIVDDFNVMENIILGGHREERFTKWGLVLDYERAERHSNALVKDYSVATPGIDVFIKNLSGGNQQRIVVAREFDRNPKLILAAQPTRGLDIGATEYVRKKLLEMRDEGSAVLLISADLDEIWALSDKIAVIYEGKIIAVRKPEETSEMELGLLMTGGRKE
jgi:simple sugar transport system ATP-binding protein